MWKKTTILALCPVIVGCASGNRYNYRSQAVTLPLRVTEPTTVVLSIEEQRPYVLNGEKHAEFVGLQRGGWGNPFDVTTASGQPLTEDMQVAVAGGLSNAAYQVVGANPGLEPRALIDLARQQQATRIIRLKVREWRSDIFMGISLQYDLQLTVQDADGKLLAEKAMQGDSAVGGGKLTGIRNSQHMAQEFSKRIGYLFNNPSIRDAL